MTWHPEERNDREQYKAAQVSTNHEWPTARAVDSDACYQAEEQFRNQPDGGE
jgi:hypothetical protein